MALNLGKSRVVHKWFLITNFFVVIYWHIMRGCTYLEWLFIFNNIRCPFMVILILNFVQTSSSSSFAIPLLRSKKLISICLYCPRMHNLIHFPRTKTPMRIISNYCPYKLVHETTFCNENFKRREFLQYIKCI